MKLDLINKSHIQEIIKMEQDADTIEFIIPYSIQKHLSEINYPFNKYLGIYFKEQLVGFFILGIEEKGKRVEFRRIVVRQKGMGFGQEAIILLEEYCRLKWNIKIIWLDVFAFNHRAVHIYEKLGYKQIGENFYKNKKLLVMEKYI